MHFVNGFFPFRLSPIALLLTMLHTWKSTFVPLEIPLSPTRSNRFGNSVSWISNPLQQIYGDLKTGDRARGIISPQNQYLLKQESWLSEVCNC
jgi:hypothetical protein